MVKSLRKSLTKLKPYLVFCILIIAIAILLANIVLSSFKNTITQTINRHFFKTIHIEKVYYLPPNFIIFKNIALQENIHPEKKILNIPTLRISISLLRLLVNRRACIRSINFYGAATDYHNFSRFLKEDFSEILNFLRKLPRQDTGLFIKGAKLWFMEKNKSPYNIEANFGVRIKNGLLSAEGFTRKNIFEPSLGTEDKLVEVGRSIPLRYRVKGKITDNAISLDKLELAKENLYCEFRGRSDGNIFEFKGSILLNTLFTETLSMDNSWGVFKRTHLPFYLLARDDFSDSISSLKPNLYLLNIDLRIKLNYPRLEIERLNFFINNNPVRLEGNILLEAPFSCDFRLNSRFSNLESSERGAMKNISIATSANVENEELNLSGTLNIDFLEKEKDRLPLEKVALDIKGVYFLLGESPLLKMRLSEVDFLGITDVNTYHIVLDDLNIELSKLQERVKSLKFYSRFYDGFLEGDGQIEIKEFMPVITTRLKVRDAEANKLDGILIHFAKIHGKLKSQMSFFNYPQLVLKGNLVIDNGYLKDFEFFKWLADLFDLPALRKIVFEKSSSNFIVDEKGSSLLDMNLDSSDVKLSGNFKLGQGDAVTSRMSLSFSNPLIKTSHKLKPLLKLIAEGTEAKPLNFDFQMSGNLHKMNFQWLQSDFKRKMMLAIPNFIERRIERNIENIIKSISRE